MAVSGDDDLIRLSARTFIFGTAALPLVSIVICIALSLAIHGNEATRTHCNVANYLPSLSAVVASQSPERYIWRFCIALHSTPRIIVAFAFQNLLLTSPLRPLNDRICFNMACYLVCIIQIAEIIFLLSLTCISSIENHLLHASSFMGFAVCSLIFMYSATILLNHSGRRRTSSLGERSFQYKVLMCGVCSMATLGAIYFFRRHNMYCEPGVYTLFALCEYAMILSNILFHCTLSLDLHGRSFLLAAASSATGFHYQSLLLPTYETGKRST